MLNVCLPSSDSSQDVMMTNCSSVENSSCSMRPSSFASKSCTKRRHCFSLMAWALSVLSWTMTGRRSSGASLPLPLVSRALNCRLHSAMRSSLKRRSRSAAGRKGMMSGKLACVICNVSRSASTLETEPVAPRIEFLFPIAGPPRPETESSVGVLPILPPPAAATGGEAEAAVCPVGRDFAAEAEGGSGAALIASLDWESFSSMNRIGSWGLLTKRP
mmetsp:Transcript_13607/g.29987  ORF Transcript_13607/g.29987 Transcript_13607/m.29987 type:complete len:217 (+) Transcript_13607:2524-3174(+)